MSRRLCSGKFPITEDCSARAERAQTLTQLAQESFGSVWLGAPLGLAKTVCEHGLGAMSCCNPLETPFEIGQFVS